MQDQGLQRLFRREPSPAPRIVHLGSVDVEVDRLGARSHDAWGPRLLYVVLDRLLVRLNVRRSRLRRRAPECIDAPREELVVPIHFQTFPCTRILIWRTTHIIVAHPASCLGVQSLALPPTGNDMFLHIPSQKPWTTKRTSQLPTSRVVVALT